MCIDLREIHLLLRRQYAIADSIAPLLTVNVVLRVRVVRLVIMNHLYDLKQVVLLQSLQILRQLIHFDLQQIR